MAEPLLFPNEPPTYWLEDDLKNLLLWAVEQGASDIQFLPNSPVWIRQHGVWLSVTHRSVTSDETMQLIDTISRTPSASGQLKGGVDKDFAYEVPVDRFNSERFRVNASACRDGWATGASMVMRSIPSLPPQMEELGVEQEIIDNAFPGNGLVLVTGVMGTGKSTLLASMLRYVHENEHKHIVTYEHPIEFDLMSIENGKGPLVQVSIPEHLESFTLAPKNAARKAVDIALVGESRDRETMKGMLENAEVGMAVYSTVHTKSVSATPTRIINVFPQDMRDQIIATLVPGLRMIIQQRLFPSPKGGRVALREFLTFDRDVRDILIKTPMHEFELTIQELVEERGQSLLKDVQAKYEQNLVSDETVKEIEVEFSKKRKKDN